VHFSYEILAPKITKLCFGFEMFLAPNISEKSVRKTLMKLTPGTKLSVFFSICEHSGKKHFYHSRLLITSRIAEKKQK
jgi:hypothetical protein